jgi:hypothetical protein
LRGILLEKVIELWADKAINELGKKKATKREKRLTLMKQIKNAKTNDERKILSVILSDINK